jgi:hypothetical protein
MHSTQRSALTLFMHSFVFCGVVVVLGVIVLVVVTSEMIFIIFLQFVRAICEQCLPASHSDL